MSHGGDPKVPRAARPNMPGYGIVGPDEGEGLLPWSWAAERLVSSRNYFIATTRPDGRPHVMVIWGCWLDESFSFSTSRSSRKGKNLAASSHCVICPDDGEEAVIVEGTAAEITDPQAQQRFATAYQAKYEWDINDMHEPMWVVRPKVVYGQIEKSYTKSATRWSFEA